MNTPRSQWLLAAACLAAGALHSAETKPPCCRELPGAASYSDRSLYQLESTWTSDTGRKIKLGVLRGRPQVLVMFFASCEYTCPIIVHDMKRIEQALPAALRGEVDFLLVSFDTARDTPAALRAYREKEKLATANWTLLQGKADDVRELAALLGINFQRDARGQFAHSNLITVLNTEGEIVHQLSGLKQDLGSTLRAIAGARATEKPVESR